LLPSANIGVSRSNTTASDSHDDLEPSLDDREFDPADLGEPEQYLDGRAATAAPLGSAGRGCFTILVHSKPRRLMVLVMVYDE